jgi:hypothetical protein
MGVLLKVKDYNCVGVWCTRFFARRVFHSLAVTLNYVGAGSGPMSHPTSPHLTATRSLSALLTPMRHVEIHSRCQYVDKTEPSHVTFLQLLLHCLSR